MYIYSTIIMCVCLLESTHHTAAEDQMLKECGSSKHVFKLRPRIMNGDRASLGTFPWHAGLYYRNATVDIWDQKCGGSLITDQYILTAAHCVAGINSADVRVALGKYFRSWDVREDYEQKRNVSKISYPEEFAKPSFYFDIALLLLDEKIKTNKAVMPVCTKFLGNSNFLLDKKLLIAGWGQTKNVRSGSSSETLLYNDVMFIPPLECKKHVPTVFAIFDKFCTMGNDSEYSIAQQGDSGGGLTVVHEGLHYIYGIVSVKLKDAKMTFFTNITWPTHLSWMENELRTFDSSFRWSEKSASNVTFRHSYDRRVRTRWCVLPSQPRHGIYQSVSCSVNDTSVACLNMPGVDVPPGWELRYSCYRGYSPSQADNSVCEDGDWRNPTDCIISTPCVSSGCKLPDHPLHGAYTSHTMRQCRSDDTSPACRDVPGTLVDAGWMVKYTCDEGYNPDSSNQFSTCYNADWNNKVDCISCGIMSQSSSKAPWFAAIFIRKGREQHARWEGSCGGTLIAPRIVLTAAICITKENDPLQPTDIRVGLGKYNRDFYSNDSLSVISMVKQVVVSKEYDASDSLQGVTIGLLYLEEPVTITSSIMPACVDWSNAFTPTPGSTGNVASWDRSKAKVDGDASKIYQLAYIEYSECITKYPGNVKRLLTPSEFCAESPNGLYTLVALYLGDGYTISHNGSQYVVGVFVSYHRSGLLSGFFDIKNRRSWLLEEIDRLENEG